MGVYIANTPLFFFSDSSLNSIGLSFSLESKLENNIQLMKSATVDKTINPLEIKINDFNVLMVIDGF